MRAALAAALALALAGSAAHAQQPQSLDSAREVVDQYSKRFATVDAVVARGLSELYHPDIVLEDPITRVEGLTELELYFERFVETSRGASFEIRQSILEPDQAAVFWTMVFATDDGSEGRRLDGVSHLDLEDGRIRRQRDYFDLGEAVYERVPVVGWILRRVKGSLAH